VPNNSLEDTGFLFDKGKYGLLSNGLVGGYLPEANLHNMYSRMDLYSSSGLAEFFVGETLLKRWTVDATYFPAAMGICGFDGTVVCLVNEMIEFLLEVFSSTM